MRGASSRLRPLIRTPSRNVVFVTNARDENKLVAWVGGIRHVILAEYLIYLFTLFSEIMVLIKAIPILLLNFQRIPYLYTLLIYVSM